MIRSISISILSAIVLAACSSNRESQPDKQDKAAVASMIKDEAGRARFNELATDKQVETLNALAINTKSVIATRKSTEVKDDKGSPQVPAMPDKMIASVEIRSSLPTTEYNGEYIVQEVTAQNIRGKANDSDFTIYYKLPNLGAFNIQNGARLSLDYSEIVDAGSAGRRVVLSDKGDLILLALEHGGVKPVTAEIKGLKLSVEQVDEKNGSVRIRFNNDRFSLKLGEKLTRSNDRHTYGFYLRSSYVGNPGDVTAEGYPYFVKLYAYMVK